MAAMHATSHIKPGPVLHWVPLIWCCFYEWAWHPAVVDDQGTLVRLNASKATIYTGGLDNDYGY